MNDLKNIDVDFLKMKKMLVNEIEYYASKSRNMGYCILYFCDFKYMKVQMYELDFKNKMIKDLQENINYEQKDYFCNECIKISYETALSLIKEVIDMQYLYSKNIQFKYMDIYEKASKMFNKNISESIIDRYTLENLPEYVNMIKRTIINNDAGLIYDLLVEDKKENYKNKIQFILSSEPNAMGYIVNKLNIKNSEIYINRNKYIFFIYVEVILKNRSMFVNLYVELLRQEKIYKIAKICAVNFKCFRKSIDENMDLSVREIVYELKDENRNWLEEEIEFADFFIVGETKSAKIYKKVVENDYIYIVVKCNKLKVYISNEDDVVEFDKVFIKTYLNKIKNAIYSDVSKNILEVIEQEFFDDKEVKEDLTNKENNNILK